MEALRQHCPHMATDASSCWSREQRADSIALPNSSIGVGAMWTLLDKLNLHNVNTNSLSAIDMRSLSFR
jgi:hypothetical protein